MQKHRSRLRPHAVEWLEDDTQRIAVVPDLGGRIIEWQVGGREWLTPADPDSTWSLHPFSGGYAESVILGMYVTRGWGEVYRAAWLGEGQRRRLSLSAKIGEHLRLTRTLWLEGGALHLSSFLVNRAPVPLRCGWGGAIRFALPAPAQIVVQGAAGETVTPWEALPNGAALNFTGEKAPRGGWQVITSQGQIHHTFLGVALERFSMSKQEAPQTLALEWRTAPRELAPRETIGVTQVIKMIL